MPQRFSSSGPVIAGLGFGVAVGVAIGAFALGPTVAGSAGGDDAVRDEFRQVVQDNQVLQAQSKSGDSVVSELSPTMVDGSLAGRPVLVMTTSNAQSNEVDGIKALLASADIENAGTIDLADAFFDQSRADELKSLIANTLPAGAQLSTKQQNMGTHAGESLGAALYMDPESTQPLASVADRATVLQALRDAGFIDYEDGTILPAQAIVVIDGRTSGTAGDAFKSDNLSAMLTALNKTGRNAVLAGRIESTSDEGVIGKLRSAKGNEVSTVDSIDRSWARMATVLAVREQLDGGHGAYGAAADVDAAAPPLPNAAS